VTEGAAPASPPARRGAAAVFASFALAASTYALFGPTGHWEDSTGASGTTSLWGQIRDGEEDRFLLGLVFLPAAFALGALLLEPTRARRAGRAVAAFLLLVFTFLTGFSVGLFFLPATLAMVVAAVLPDRTAAVRAP
jgi:hypothetical protein